jgi:hypothetical protein
MLNAQQKKEKIGKSGFASAKKILVVIHSVYQKITDPKIKIAIELLTNLHLNSSR